eukprot:m.1518850 g.1518850  ORF g.1518850 m.1518850 type:complete len:173 (-) comp25222_c1_seq8:5448-5966(-)
MLQETAESDRRKSTLSFSLLLAQTCHETRLFQVSVQLLILVGSEDQCHGSVPHPEAPDMTQDLQREEIERRAQPTQMRIELRGGYSEWLDLLSRDKIPGCCNEFIRELLDFSREHDVNQKETNDTQSLLECRVEIVLLALVRAVDRIQRSEGWGKLLPIGNDALVQDIRVRL